MVFWTAVGVVSLTGAIIHLARRYFTGAICKDRSSLAGKTVIVTGANCGIGKAVTRILAERDARVILACRNTTTGAEAASEVAKATGHDATQLVVKHLDLASLESVTAFCADIVATEPRIDVIVCNAGLASLPQLVRTVDGFETQMGVNHLGHVALTQRLLPVLKASAPSRIVAVSSVLYKNGNVDPNYLNYEQKKYDPNTAYADSKLATILYNAELGRRLADSRVNVFSASPGIVYTNLGRFRSFTVLEKILAVPFAILFVRTPHQGAQNVIHCATEPSLEDPAASGKFYRDCREKELVKGHQAEDPELALRVYEASLKLVGMEPDKKT